MRDPFRHARTRVDLDVYEIRPAAGGGFLTFERALARKLMLLAARPQRHAVIVGPRDGSNRFTQVLVDTRYGALVEAVSNDFLGKEHRLGPEALRRLMTLGFTAPSGDWPNFVQAVLPPADWSGVAELLVRPLELVYGVTADAAVTVEAFEVPRPPGSTPPSAAVLAELDAS